LRGFHSIPLLESVKLIIGIRDKLPAVFRAIRIGMSVHHNNLSILLHLENTQDLSPYEKRLILSSSPCIIIITLINPLGNLMATQMVKALLWESNMTSEGTVIFACGYCKKVSKSNEPFIGAWKSHNIDVIASKCTLCSFVNTFWSAENFILTPYGLEEVSPVAS
jgi:hypothetical protein